MPRDVAVSSGFPPPTAAPVDQHARARAAYDDLDDLGEAPRAPASEKEAPCQATVPGPPGASGGGRGGTERTGLHHCPEGGVQRIRKLVDPAEQASFDRPDAILVNSD